MQACFKFYLKNLNGVKVSIIKEPKLLFEQTQLNKIFNFIKYNIKHNAQQIVWAFTVLW
jgi:hypothetical protein